MVLQAMYMRFYVTSMENVHKDGYIYLMTTLIVCLFIYLFRKMLTDALSHTKTKFLTKKGGGGMC